MLLYSFLDVGSPSRAPLARTMFPFGTRGDALMKLKCQFDMVLGLLDACNGMSVMNCHSFTTPFLLFNTVLDAEGQQFGPSNTHRTWKKWTNSNKLYFNSSSNG